MVLVVFGIFDIDLFVVHEVAAVVVAEAPIVATVATVAAVATGLLLHSLVLRASVLEPNFDLQLTKRIRFSRLLMKAVAQRLCTKFYGQFSASTQR